VTTKLTLDTETVNHLDLSMVQAQIDLMLENLTAHEQQLKFDITYEQEDDDPRELSEIPEIRLWYVRLDAAYPWIPFLLNWQEGELARYVAMLVAIPGRSRIKSMAKLFGYELDDAFFDMI